MTDATSVQSAIATLGPSGWNTVEPAPGARPPVQTLNYTTKRNTSAIIPFMPQSVATAFTGTHNLLMTAPGEFDAVALVAMNADVSAVTWDNAIVAVSERSDTVASRTVPVVGGTAFNALAAAGTQQGFVPVTWDGGSTSTSIPAGTVTTPTIKLSDWIPLSSIPRVDNTAGFPLVMARVNYVARALSVHVFPNGTEVDTFNTLMSPYEWYQTAQAVDGVTTPANYTQAWTAGANTQSVRLFGMAFRLRGTGHLVMACGDSILRSLAAAGGLASLAASNSLSGWFPLLMKAMASKANPVGFCNLSVSSKPSATYTADFKTWAQILKPSVGMIPPYSPNDGAMTVSVSSVSSNRALDFADWCRDRNILPVVITPVPYGGSGSETRRSAFVTKMRALSGVRCLDVNTPVNDPANVANNYWTTGSNFDDTHPSATGHQTIATARTTDMLSILG